MSRIICFCSGVREWEIKSVVKKNNLNNLKEVQLATGAATGCGRCIPAIDKLLKSDESVDLQSKLF